jgi:integrating conjugative element protein (TIGR03752 family)
MKVKSSLLVKVIVPAMLAGGVVVGLRSCGAHRASPADAQRAALTHTLADLSPDELKSLGVEGDTPEDTLHTLIGSLNTVRTEQKQLSQENEALRKQNTQLSHHGQDVSGQVNEAVSDLQKQYDARTRQLQDEQQTLKSQLQSMADRLANAGATSTATGQGASGDSDIPAGLGLDGLGHSQASPATTGDDGLMWVSPTDQQPTLPGQADGKTGPQFPTSFLDDNPLTRQKAAYEMQVKGHTTENGTPPKPTEHPVFTLPENSTLVGSRAMTALLGRVPVNGTVTDPYPFKVLIGKDNLTANGIELPDVEGAVVSGSASGDWTLSCVRGQVTSITFVFADGTVRTLPHPVELASGTGNAGSSKTDTGTNGGIGWISDDDGIPCISGTRKSNAATYLPTLFGLSAAGAAGEAMSQSQQTTQTNGYGGVTSTLTGDAGKAALGKAIAGGMNETGEWVRQRYGQMFDAIYVPPGAHLAVHITRQLNIDYEDPGRRVRYDFTLPGEAGANGGLD